LQHIDGRAVDLAGKLELAAAGGLAAIADRIAAITKLTMPRIAAAEIALQICTSAK
jgi:hypothetical protein